MRYKLFFIFFIIFVFAPQQPAFGEDSRYRVEILVLTHLRHDEEPREVLTLDDLSYALDFLSPPKPEAESGEAADTPAQSIPPEPAAPTGESLSEEELPEAEEENPLDVVVHVEEMGPEMQEAWRRLRLSAPFRPLQYLAWEQGSNAPFPVLRIHDLEPVRVVDPWAEERLALAEGQSVAVFGDTIPTAVEPGSEPDETALPDPIVYYRLDGTASLTRSRFLHLRLAIEWREPVFAPGALPTTAPPSPAGAPAPAAAQPTGFRVHRLEQSRPVRTGRMEYFDDPVLGVLAWITDITDTLSTTEPE